MDENNESVNISEVAEPETSTHLNESSVEEQETEEKKSPLIPILLGVTAAVVIGVVIFLGVIVLGSGLFSSSKAVEVPNVVGETITSAQEKYKDFDFSGYQTAYSEEYAEGIIFEQKPKAGSKTKKYEIEVWVSLGAKKGVIPDVTNYEVSAAIEELKKAGFEAKPTLIQEYSSSVANGLVTRTNPQMNEEAPLSTVVQIYYSVEKVEKVLFEGVRHEYFNDTSKGEAFEKILSYCESVKK